MANSSRRASGPLVGRCWGRLPGLTALRVGSSVGHGPEGVVLWPSGLFMGRVRTIVRTPAQCW
jgi:hypothetical protein